MAEELKLDRAQVVTAHLVVSDSNAAIDFYKRAFGAIELYRLTSPNGAIVHAEIKIGQSLVMLADEAPEHGSFAPKTIGGTPVILNLKVADVDTLAKAAVACGAEVLIPVADQFYGERSGRLRDPFGHLWIVGTHIEDVTPEEMQSRADKLYGAS